MKKILINFLLFASVSVFAQQEVNISFANQMDYMFGSLDKNKITHGILLDYGMEFTNVPAFNGTLTDSTYTDLTTLKQIYNTLLTSRIKNVSTGFVTPETFDLNLKNNRQEEIIVLSGLYFKYNAFVDNATTTNKLTYSNGKFYDKYINGIWQNPYSEKQVFAMSPAIKSYKGQNITVKIPSSIFYSNFQNTVQSIQIDFDNGQGYITIPFNQNISISYSSIGVKNWKYKLTLTNGSTLYNQSRIKIEEGLNTIPYGSNASLTPQTQNTTSTTTLYSHTISATTPYSGQYGTVKLTIDDAGNNGIRKPLIVAEGFDLGVILQPENANGMNNYNTFNSSINQSGSLELRELLTFANRQYDIIYVDWNNGVDYLQRNAYALEAVIAWVNQQKALNGSTEQNVVLGQSMGGVIARYALADMEQSGLNHDTRLFVSHDAPQQGANMPVSLQYLYRHLTNQYIQTNTTLFGGIITVPILENNFGVSDYLSILDTPATRQLLKNWVMLNYNLYNNVHEDFYNELKSKGLANSGGYPVNCRNIAISNGAECGNTQNFNAGDHLLNFQWNKGLSFWGDLASLIYNPLGGTIGGLFLDNDFFGVAILGMIPGHSKYNVDFQAKSIPYGFNNQIYKGRVSYTKKILWLFNVTIEITNVQKNQPNGVLQFDNYGGGYYNTNLIASNINNSNLFIRDRFNFIPTTSALDIGKRNITLNDFDYKNSYIGALPPSAPKNSPFQNFSTEFDKYNSNAHNKQHITFNDRNGNWLAKELVGTNIETTDCSAFCENAQITGSSLLCTTGNYSVTNEATYSSWSISEGSSLVTMSVSGNQVTINQINPSSSGYITLNVTYSNTKCGTTSASKRIWVGRPNVQDQNIYGGYDNVPKNTSSTFSVTPVPGATQYYWTIYINSNSCGCTTDSEGLVTCPSNVNLPKFSANNSMAYTTSSTSTTVNWGNCVGTYTVNCIAKNNCGSDGIYYKVVNVFNPNGGGGSNPCEGNLLLSPNPINRANTSGDLVVNIVYPGDPCDDELNTLARNNVQIYDLQGFKKYENDFSEDNFSINNPNLERGHYIINVTTKKGYTKRKIFIVQ